MSAKEATAASIVIRHACVELRLEVKAGRLALAPLLAERRPEVESVRVFRLLAWLPRVNETRADRLLRGLPGHRRLRGFTPSQRALLQERVEHFERTRRG